jgi:hypothetical protein
VLAPARITPVLSECSTRVTHTQDGNVFPLLCRNHGVNVVAWRFYARGGNYLLALGKRATYARVNRYYCSLLGANNRYLTYPEVESMFTLATAYFGWRIPEPPLATANPGECAVVSSPTSALRAELPRYENCSQTPELKPSTMSWCTSACSPYFNSITWSTWTHDRAVGSGTEVAPTGVGGCAGSQLVYYPNTRIVLTHPVVERFCAWPASGRSKPREFLGPVFTRSNVYPSFELTSTSSC